MPKACMSASALRPRASLRHQRLGNVDGIDWNCLGNASQSTNENSGGRVGRCGLCGAYLDCRVCSVTASVCSEMLPENPDVVDLI